MKLTCQRCGVGFEQVEGRPAKYCHLHRKAGNRARDLKALEAQDPERAADVRAALDASAEERSLTGQVVMLAACLAIEPDLERAAQHAGITVRGKALAELERLARAHHPALVSAEQGAAVDLLTKAGNLTAARLVADAASVPVSMLGNTVKSIHTAKQLLTGGTRPTYSHIRLVINAPKGNK